MQAAKILHFWKILFHRWAKRGIDRRGFPGELALLIGVKSQPNDMVCLFRKTVEASFVSHILKYQYTASNAHG